MIKSWFQAKKKKEEIFTADILTCHEKSIAGVTNNFNMALFCSNVPVNHDGVTVQAQYKDPETEAAKPTSLTIILIIYTYAFLAVTPQWSHCLLWMTRLENQTFSNVPPVKVNALGFELFISAFYENLNKVLPTKVRTFRIVRTFCSVPTISHC